MSLGARIEERINALGISQAELARRAKLPQTTVNSLIRGGRRSSPHLVVLARELGTTAAYLAGESDDPKAETCHPRQISSNARELLDCFDTLSEDEQRALLQVARSMSGRG
ncbi:helix-turn-helix domain-containing protein [Sphingomonas sp. H39-1-10]|uniref:helix-turn-helix domain-containing protein n=1 Tax=Sphingomonas pollutisoli TaxID=3030829 RepID=UPI0023B906D4|nr:helix-turn-helix domain-containing protein [Sphingomonas pollutisoli]MDF0489187.1 helix-turn-helix domain-containing protein [Sphingomonas pollutisoli]